MICWHIHLLVDNHGLVSFCCCFLSLPQVLTEPWCCLSALAFVSIRNIVVNKHPHVPGHTWFLLYRVDLSLAVQTEEKPVICFLLDRLTRTIISVSQGFVVPVFCVQKEAQSLLNRTLSCRNKSCGYNPKCLYYSY